ncbi:hypothetical protein [Galbitalea soli]|uniref:Bulb-type lectin domain-containing protein n=1 Tax=Galbitalea soli TaxID=1268042 RepID=A0A7C9TRI1_9MICO|nr:hypothetical protein [Galbitalea soli]NEM91023.1 hypothetical protein [Galbitalea soli]NYJ29711.1 putative heme/steroid binding protein [Galbitalea soli]
MHIQTDGNVVIYDPSNNPVWSSGTGQTDATGGLFRLQDDGNLVYQAADHSVIWNSASVYGVLYAGEVLRDQWMMRKYGFRLVMQHDGNLVLLRESNSTVVWNSNTDVNVGAYTILQATDGNLVVYSSAKTALWYSGSPHQTGTYATIESWGAVGVHSSSGSLLWSSTPKPASTSLDGIVAAALSYEGNDFYDMQAIWPAPYHQSSVIDWCAIFASFVTRNGGVAYNASSIGLYDSLPHNSPAGSIRRGDIIYYKKAGVTDGHTGFVYDVSGGIARTIEGNAGSGTTASTSHVKRYPDGPWDPSAVVGYAHPTYA